LVDVSTSVPDPTDPKQAAVIALLQLNPVALELGELFAAAGHSLALVGGSVRDALLGRLGDDLDFTTDARPEQILKLVRPWADAVWDVGIAFGTVGRAEGRAEAGDHHLPHRGVRPRPPASPRSPTATPRGRPGPPGLHRQRDGGALPEVEFVDPHGGLEDLAGRCCAPRAPPRTPSPTTRCG
jgi:poly(A) polymerase